VIMKLRHFFQKIQDDRLVRAIREAENKSSGEIRVFISRQAVEDSVAAAAARFTRLGMEKTAGRNGVLIFVAPRSQNFAIIGDLAVHEKCGPAFWESVAGEMAGHFRKSQFTEAILAGIRRAGDLLAQHFPRSASDQNELPDGIERD
jgi:uncharacterized membrane protein